MTGFFVRPCLQKYDEITMKPILIISHTACETQDYLYEFLDKQEVAHETINHEDDELVSRKQSIKIIVEEN